MVRTLLASASSVLLAVPLWGQDSLQEVFKEYRQAQKNYVAARTEALEVYHEEALQDRLLAMDGLQARLEGPRRVILSVRERFRQVFARTDWRKLDPERDSLLLQEGWLAVGEDAIDHDPQLAVESLERLVRQMPRSDAAQRARLYHLARAYVATGRLGRATAHVRTVLADADPAEQPRLKLQLGDLLAAAGDVDSARDLYGQVAERDDHVARQARLRLALVGKPAPEIEDRIWIGDGIQSLSRLRGKMVVLDFWATWCQSCRRGMQSLDELAARIPTERLCILGITRFYPKGYMPGSREELVTGGRELTNLERRDYFTHLRKFRDHARIRYPFIIGNGSDFDRYQVVGVPTTVVIDDKGIVQLVVMGLRAKNLVRASVELMVRD